MTVRAALAAFVLIILTACGGGGGDGASLPRPQAASESAFKSLASSDLAVTTIDHKLLETGSPSADKSEEFAFPLRPLALSPWGPRRPITFMPDSLSGNQMNGVSGSYSLYLQIENPAIFSDDVYAVVLDSQRILNATDAIRLTPLAQSIFALTLRTSASLATGRYQGTFPISFCRDALCNQPYTGISATLPYDISVTPKPLLAQPLGTTIATAHVGGTNPQSVNVQLSGPPGNWTATTSANWLVVDSPSGGLPAIAVVRIVTQGQAVGRYQGEVVFKSSDGQQARVAFALEMLPTQFTASTNALRFVGVNGAQIPPQTLSFNLDNQASVPWSATTASPWLLLSPASGVTPGSLVATVDPGKSSLASGAHAASLQLQSLGYPSKTVNADLSLIRPSFSASSTTVVLGGAKGRDDAAQSITMSLNTGSNKWPWTITSAIPAWATPSALSGHVDASGTALSFSPTPGVAPGSYAAVVTVSAKVNGDTVSLPVTLSLNRDRRKLLPSEWGVGFASTSVGAALTRTLRVADSFEGSLPWAATSSAAWLSVTNSGVTGAASDLTLTANPALAPMGVVSYATVTLKTSTPGVEGAVVKVAMWRSIAGLNTVTSLPLSYSTVVADKIRPYVYAHNGGTFIDVYNAHLGAKINTIPNVAGALGDMTVSPDGAHLYALDTPNKTAAIVDLTTMSKSSTLVLDANAYPPAKLLAIRVNGKDVVLAEGRTAYMDGKFVSTGISGYGALTVAASADGKKVFSQDSGLSPSSVSAYDVDYSSVAGGTLMVKLLAAGGIDGASNGQDIATNAEGTALYTASGAPYRCASANPTTLTFIGSLPGGEAYPNNVEVLPDGRVICGISGWYSAADIWLHAPNGALLNSFKFAGYAQNLLPRQLVVTPDGITAVGLTNDPRMAFIPLGAP